MLFSIDTNYALEAGDFPEDIRLQVAHALATNADAETVVTIEKLVRDTFIELYGLTPEADRQIVGSYQSMLDLDRRLEAQLVLGGQPTKVLSRKKMALLDQIKALQRDIIASTNNGNLIKENLTRFLKRVDNIEEGIQYLKHLNKLAGLCFP